MLANFPLAFSSDAAVFQTWKGTSLTPCAAQMLCLPPEFRSTSLGYLLLAVLPPKVLNYNVLYREVLTRTQGKVEVLDHSVTPAVCRTIDVGITRIIEDTRGLPKPVCNKQSPAIIGMCPFCKVKGVPCYSTVGKQRTAYLCAATMLGTRYIYVICEIVI
jgi:hypothetical protein